MHEGIGSDDVPKSESEENTFGDNSDEDSDFVPSDDEKNCFKSKTETEKSDKENESRENSENEISGDVTDKEACKPRKCICNVARWESTQ